MSNKAQDLRIGFMTFDHAGPQEAVVPEPGKYIQFDGVMGWLKAEAAAWEDAAAQPPVGWTPEVCRGVAASLRQIAEREWVTLEEHTV